MPNKSHLFLNSGKDPCINALVNFGLFSLCKGKVQKQSVLAIYDPFQQVRLMCRSRSTILSRIHKKMEKRLPVPSRYICRGRSDFFCLGLESSLCCYCVGNGEDRRQGPRKKKCGSLTAYQFNFFSKIKTIIYRNYYFTEVHLAWLKAEGREFYIESSGTGALICLEL